MTDRSAAARKAAATKAANIAHVSNTPEEQP